MRGITTTAMRHTILPALVLFLGLALACPGTAQSAAPDAAGMGLATSPATIDMGAQYDGIGLKVTGQAPAGDDLVLRFTGEPTELHMRVKGKVFGLLWMNVGKMVLGNVPKVLIVDSSRPMDELGAAAEDLRLSGVRKAIEVESGATEDIDAPMELVHLKQGEELYAEEVGGIEFGPEKDGMRSFTATLALPSGLTPGQYKVEAFSLRGGAITAQASEPIRAQLTGAPEWLANMAFDHGAMYGVLAVIIAIICGLAIGLVFQSKGAH